MLRLITLPFSAATVERFSASEARPSRRAGSAASPRASETISIANLRHGAPGCGDRAPAPQPSGTANHYFQLPGDRVGVHLRAFSVRVSNSCQPAEHDPVKFHFLLLLWLAGGRLAHILLTV